ncbi:MFS transporter [Streptomyces abyssomicinicus]|uniref:MFS transporter n=1 Tax=Streptomyces abyssomicinicus TaxID=574929 RepID=UPI0013DE85D5
MRSLGSSVGAAVIGVVLAQMTATTHGHALISEGGFRVGLTIGCAVGVVAAVVSIALPRTRRVEGSAAADQPSPAPEFVKG